MKSLIENKQFSFVDRLRYYLLWDWREGGMAISPPSLSPKLFKFKPLIQVFHFLLKVTTICPPVCKKILSSATYRCFHPCCYLYFRRLTEKIILNLYLWKREECVSIYFKNYKFQSIHHLMIFRFLPERFRERFPLNNVINFAFSRVRATWLYCWQRRSSKWN